MTPVRKISLFVSIGLFGAVFVSPIFSDPYPLPGEPMMQGEDMMSEPPGVTLTPNETGVEIKVVLAEKSDLDVSILGEGGKKIRTLFKGPLERGYLLAVPWDGKNDAGAQLPSGFYVADIQTPYGPLHREGFFISASSAESQGF